MVNDEVILGSGKLYLAEYTGNIPTDTLLETTINSVGRIKGGASLEYKPTVYDVTDDSGEIVKRFVTKEDCTFKSGILTWDLENINKLSPAVLTDDTVKKEKVLKIGGAKTLKNYALRFVHTKDDGSKLRVTMVASNGNGFSLKFDGSKETTIDAEYKAISQADGLLVEIRDQYELPPFTLISATRTVDNDVMLVMSNTVKAGSVPLIGFALKTFSNPNVILSAFVGSESNTIILVPTSNVLSGETVTIAYTKPAEISNQVKSALGVALETFTTTTVVTE